MVFWTKQSKQRPSPRTFNADHGAGSMPRAVALLSDAVPTRMARNRELAINKMAKAGAIISSIEVGLFELCPAGTPEFKQAPALVKQLS